MTVYKTINTLSSSLVKLNDMYAKLNKRVISMLDLNLHTREKFLFNAYVISITSVTSKSHTQQIQKTNLYSDKFKHLSIH